MKCNKFFAKAMAVVMAFALAAPLMTACSDSDDSDTQDNSGSTTTEYASLEGTQWKCDSTLTIGATQIQYTSTINFSEATSGTMTIGINLLPAELNFPITYTFERTTGAGTLTSTTSQATINFNESDASTLDVVLTPAIFGDTTGMANSLFMAFGGQIHGKYIKQ